MPSPILPSRVEPTRRRCKSASRLRRGHHTTHTSAPRRPGSMLRRSGGEWCHDHAQAVGGRLSRVSGCPELRTRHLFTTRHRKPQRGHPPKATAASKTRTSGGRARQEPVFFSNVRYRVPASLFTAACEDPTRRNHDQGIESRRANRHASPLRRHEHRLRGANSSRLARGRSRCAQGPAWPSCPGVTFIHYTNVSD